MDVSLGQLMNILGAGADEVQAVQAVASAFREYPRVISNTYFWREEQVPRIKAAFQRYRERPRVTGGRPRTRPRKRWQEKLAENRNRQRGEPVGAAERGEG